MNRRTFILILAILLFVAAAAGAYYLIVKKPQPTSAPVAENPSPLAPVPVAEAIISEPVISPVLSFNGETVWFMSADGRLYRQAVAAGAVKEEYLLPAPVENPRRVVWQRQGNDLIIEQISQGHIRYQFYSAANKVFVPYEAALREPAFLFDDKQIAYIWVAEGGKNELTISDPDGKNYKKLSDLYRPDYEMVVSPTKNQILLFADDAANPDNLLAVDLESGQFTILDEKARYADAKFSPDGNFVVVEKAGSLVLYDLNTGQSEDLNIQGSVGQTAWSRDSEQIYIADSEKIRSYSLAAKSRIDIYTFSADAALVPSEIFVHPVKPIIFFTDSASGYLYRLDFE